MLALPVFPGRPGIVLPLRNMPVASFRQKKAPTFQSRLLCWHYLSSRVGQVLSWRSNSPVDCCSQNCLEIKKEPSFRLTLSMFALPIFPGRPMYCPCVKTCRWHVLARKNPQPYGWGFVFALPIFPGSRPPSIVGADELNFCVRDGNRWTLIAINTNFIWTAVNRLLYQSLSAEITLVTHTGFEPMLTA